MKLSILSITFAVTMLLLFTNFQTVSAQQCGARDIVIVRGTTSVGVLYDANNLALIGFTLPSNGTVQFEISHEYSGPGVLTSDGYIKLRSYDAAGNQVDSLDITPARVTYNEFDETFNGIYFDTYRSGAVSSVNGIPFGFGIGMDDVDAPRDALPNSPLTYLNDISLWSWGLTGGINLDVEDDGLYNDLGYGGPITQMSATMVPRCASPAAVSTYVSSLPVSSFNSHGQQNAMLARIENIRQKIASGDTGGALQELSNLRRKVDGCGTAADNNDWITDCAAQAQVRSMIDQIIISLGGQP